jgi:hypothetical protein
VAPYRRGERPSEHKTEGKHLVETENQLTLTVTRTLQGGTRSVRDQSHAGYFKPMFRHSPVDRMHAIPYIAYAALHLISRCSLALPTMEHIALQNFECIHTGPSRLHTTALSATKQDELVQQANSRRHTYSAAGRRPI